MVSWSLGGAILAALGAGLCCLGPLLYLVFGVSAAALSGLQQLSWLQIPLGIVSLGLLAVGYYRLYLSKRFVCTQVSLSSLRIAYWIVLALVVVLLSYPFTLPILFELLS